MTLWLKVTGWVVGLFSNYLVPVLSFLAGKKAAKSDAVEEELKAVRDVKKIHARIDRDGSYLERVRDLFRKS